MNRPSTDAEKLTFLERQLTRLCEEMFADIKFSSQPSFVLRGVIERMHQLEIWRGPGSSEYKRLVTERSSTEP